ncbi:MAG: NADP-dependent malic enzyme [Pseudomonadales bacterium]|jgi:malate dehydrogenase (oxaloacetate-decarboxylating)(NADP+)|nr:NADP-dependent malic enzyme [Gammaproteobacteria bacterium]MBP6051916.1 NADP-dependent malic enzyme [Pseudomonadales bacterium]
MEDSFRESSIRYHTDPAPGKLAIVPTKPLANKRDLARAYSPGVAYACELIEKDPNEAANVTIRGNLVAVVTNGTAVLGLGDIGPLAAKPVMEGKAVLFKKFADIDVFDIEIDEKNVDKLVDIIAALEPTFGGINLEDIKAPECFLVEQKLRERMKIPVFHDDQHGTAIVAGAAVYNGLRIVDKQIGDVKMVVSGSGAASIACVDLLVTMGLKPEHVTLVDRSGVVYLGRTEGMNPWKQKYARETPLRTLDEAMDGADIFMGLSGPGVLKAESVRKMAPHPLILAMANPTPEIMPEEALAVRPDAILATGRSDYPNQVNNVLCFPFMFRGALDCGASTINDAMKAACVKAIAGLAEKEVPNEVMLAYAGETLKFGPEYLIPKPFDPRLIEDVPLAVVKAAMESGVATRPIEDLEAYRRKLHEFVNRSGLFMQPFIDIARKHQARIVYAEGENEDVLLAVKSVVDEGVAQPILIGRTTEIRARMDKLSMHLEIGRDVLVVDPQEADTNPRYWECYHGMVGRQGVSVAAARMAMRSNASALATVLVELGEADGMICGKVGVFADHLRTVRGAFGPGDPAQHVSSLCALLLPSGPLFLTDAFLTPDPSEEQIIQTTLASIDLVRHFGVTPKVALLAHSNFGTSQYPSALKMRSAARVLREAHPEVEIDGEMHAYTAMNEQLRKTIFPDANLSGSANLLVMPNLDAANIALGIIRSLTDALLIGPFFTGFSKPAHVVIPSVSPRGIFNMSAFTSAEIHRQREQQS